MITEEQLTQKIKDAEAKALDCLARAEYLHSRYAQTKKEIAELKVERMSLDERKPIPDVDGWEAKVMPAPNGYYVKSQGRDDTSCEGPVRPTADAAIEIWNQMMADPDRPRIIDDKGFRYVRFPIKVELPPRGVAIAVDRDGRIYSYTKAPKYEDGRWDSWGGGKRVPRHEMINAEDMIVKVPG